MSDQPVLPTELIRTVYGIALAPEVAARLDVVIGRSLSRVASLLSRQHIDLEGFDGSRADTTKP